MELPKWLTTRINELTLEDAMQAHADGINFICGDGKMQHVSSNSCVRLLKFLKSEEKGV